MYDLRCDTQGDCISELTLEDWVNLVEKLSVIGDNFSKIYDAYETVESHFEDWEWGEDYLRAKQAFPEEVALLDAYQKWYNESFDFSPQLGYDFAAGYFQNFWEAADKVLKYLENPDYEVWMVASY